MQEERREQLKRRVRQDYERKGLSLEKLAKKYRIGKNTISKWVKEDQWLKGSGRWEATTRQQLRQAAERLSEAALRSVGQLEQEGLDTKNIRELTGLLKEVGQLLKNTEQEETDGYVRVEWGDDVEQWSK